MFLNFSFHVKSLEKTLSDLAWLMCLPLAPSAVIYLLCPLKSDFPEEKRLPDTNSRLTSKTEARTESSLYAPGLWPARFSIIGCQRSKENLLLMNSLNIEREQDNLLWRKRWSGGKEDWQVREWVQREGQNIQIVENKVKFIFVLLYVFI